MLNLMYLCVFCGMGSIFKVLVSRNDSSGDIVMYRFRFGLKLGLLGGVWRHYFHNMTSPYKDRP